MNAHNLPRASNDTSPRSMRPQAVAGSTDTATFRHAPDEPCNCRMIGPNEFEELGSPFHWTTYACVIVCTTVALYFVGQGVRWYLGAVL